MAAQKGSVRLIGISGKTYSKAVYFNDVNNDSVKWDSGSGAGATSPDSAVFGEPVKMVDVVLAAAPATPTQLQITKGNIPTGDTLLMSLHLASITFRPQLAIYFGANERVALVQLA